MDRIPLSDESAALDDDIVEDEGSPGKEEQFDELDFREATQRGYEPDTLVYDEEDTYDDGEFADDPLNNGGWGEGDDA